MLRISFAMWICEPEVVPRIAFVIVSWRIIGEIKRGVNAPRMSFFQRR